MATEGFLRTGIKSECLGCSACVQVCPHSALEMMKDREGFRYPLLDKDKCVNCGLCNMVCPEEEDVPKYTDHQIAFGGYAKNNTVRCQSTSGGAFSCIAETYCNANYVIFGAAAEGLKVHHTYIQDKKDLNIFRKSKYLQSEIRDSYKQVRSFLKEGKKVLFSGTPCQIAGLRKYLKVSKTDTINLLTIEVVCEGVPTPLYVEKLEDYILHKYGAAILNLDYRFKDGKEDYPEDNGLKRIFRFKGRWDYEVMMILLKNGGKIKKDRWFNPFWSIWLNHLMNRPSCYKCPYATNKRVADITLGDLWGVHLYCPELYGENGGSSVVVANTDKGKEALRVAQENMYGHPLNMEDVIRYQGPMRGCVPMNPARSEFMKDIEDPGISITEINKKWAVRPSLKLLLSKYLWGNKQKVRLWKIRKALQKK